MKKVLSIILSLTMLMGVFMAGGTTAIAATPSVKAVTVSNYDKKIYYDIGLNPIGTKITVKYSDNTSQTVTIKKSAKWTLKENGDEYIVANFKLKKSPYKLRVKIYAPYAVTMGDENAKAFTATVYNSKTNKNVKTKKCSLKYYMKNDAPKSMIKSITAYNDSRKKKATNLLITYTNGKQELVKPSAKIARLEKGQADYNEGTLESAYEYSTTAYLTKYGVTTIHGYTYFKDDSHFATKSKPASDEYTSINGLYSDSAKVKSIEEFEISKKIEFKSTSLKKLTATRKGFKASWNTVKNVSGYEIQYATNKTMSNSTKASISDKDTSSKKVTKLKGAKKYYVRIRTYKNVKVNGKNQKVYSAWSAKKEIKTKK